MRVRPRRAAALRPIVEAMEGRRLLSGAGAPPQGAAPLATAAAPAESAGDHDFVFVDYGPYGLWTYNIVDGWAKINDVGPEEMVAGGSRFVVLDYGPSGVWTYSVADGWAKINPADPIAIQTGDDLYFNFGDAGLWSWDWDQEFREIAVAGPQDFLALYGTIYLDYGSAGLWSWTEASPFEQISTYDPEALAGNYVHPRTVYVDFGAAGLWAYSSGLFSKLNDRSPESMAAGLDYPHQFPGYPGDVLYLDFGDAGAWALTGSGYVQISTLDPESIVAGPDAFAYLDFGANGLWKWAKVGGLAQLNAANPDLLVLGIPKLVDATTNEIYQELYVGYGTFGFWTWTSAGWRKANDAPPYAAAL